MARPWERWRPRNARTLPTGHAVGRVLPVRAPKEELDGRGDLLVRGNSVGVN
jgi:hypothetical protein